MTEKQPVSEMVIIIRPSFKKVCGPDACRAALYNHILYRLARKAKDEPETKVKAGDVYWYASAEDICQDIDEAWCVNKVRKEIKQLVTDGLLGQRHNPNKGWDRKYQYFLAPEHGEKLLEICQKKEVCLLHIGLNSEVTHLLHMVNAFNKNGACICQKSEMDLPETANASTTNGGAIPEGSSKGSTEGSTEGSEGTQGQHREQSQTCAVAQPAPSSSQDDYRPDYHASQRRGPLTQFFEDAIAGAQRNSVSPIANDTEDTSHGFSGNSSNHLRGDRDSDSVDAGEHPQPAAGHTSRDVRLPAAGTDQTASTGRTERGTGDARTGSTGNGVAAAGGGSGYRTPAEQRAASQQNSTGTRPATVRTQGKQNEKPQLTLMGQQVRESYEIIRAVRLRMTPNNVKALNDLGDMDGMDFASLKETIELIEAQNLVKKNNIPIDVQELASEKGYWRFDKWYPVVLRNRQRQAGAGEPKGDNNLADWVAESQQQQSQMSREESARRIEEARRQLAAVQQQIAAQRAAERQQQAIVYRVKGETYA